MTPDPQGDRPIGPGEIDIWIARDEEISDEGLLNEYQACLTDAEVDRMGRFVFAKHRHQYLVRRGLLRYTLSRYVAMTPPKHWTFSTNPWGKPSIVAPRRPLDFNLSHTDGMVVLAVTSGTEVGIDVEQIDRRIDLEIADHFFSRCEVTDLRSLPPVDQQARFLTLWTLKEAYIKACGQGLSVPLDSFSFSFPGHEQIKFGRDASCPNDMRHWRFWQARIGRHMVALSCLWRNAAPGPYIRIFETVSGHPVVALETKSDWRSAS
jgi:4'-phosphopantetheinyl transferase